ncbi:MAG: hypothetical protein WEF50_15390 [Myxococcota bacterium]
MPYKGELVRGVPFTIDDAASLGAVAMTIVRINQRGGMPDRHRRRGAWRMLRRPR